MRSDSDCHRIEHHVGPEVLAVQVAHVQVSCLEVLDVDASLGDGLARSARTVRRPPRNLRNVHRSRFRSRERTRFVDRNQMATLADSAHRHRLFPAHRPPRRHHRSRHRVITAIGEIDQIRRLRATVAVTLIIRAAWLLIAVAGLHVRINHITQLA